MQQRDIILDQVVQAGKILAQLLSRFQILEGSGAVEKTIQAFGVDMKEKLDVDLEELYALEYEALEQYFEKRHFSSKHVYSLGSQLAEFAEHNMDPQQADFLLGKSIQLIRLSNELSGTFSMEKNAEMKKLQLKRKMLNGE